MSHSRIISPAMYRHHYWSWLPMIVAFFSIALCHPVFAQQPTITSFSPSQGKSGDTITINGNFLASPLTSVKFGGVNASAVIFVNQSTGTIKAVVGAGASGNVSVTTPSGTAIKSGFTFLQPPIISSFSPTSAKTGDTVTIIGNFIGTAATTVKFGGVNASAVIFVNESTIKAVVGTGASGDVSVTTPGGTATKSGFTFLQPPIIISFSPTSAKTGDTVTIIGNFIGTLATTVKFGSVNASAVIFVNQGTIKAIVGSGATGAVSVTTPSGTATKSGFTFLQPPIIISFFPTSASTGDTVLINGNFVGTAATTVKFGGVNASAVIFVDGSTLKAVVGAGASGDVSVTTPGGTAIKSGFTFLQPAGGDFVEASFPYPSANGEVRTVTSDGKGGVYIAGNFTMIDNVARNGIAHILANRTVDLAWNPDFKKNGFPATIAAIAVTSRGVHVGGNFTHVNNQPHSGFATVDFDQGQLIQQNATQVKTTFGATLQPGRVGCMAVDSLENVYVAGEFNRIQAQISKTQNVILNRAGAFKIQPNGLVDSAWIVLLGSLARTPKSIAVNSSANGKQFFGEGVFISGDATEAGNINLPISKLNLTTGAKIASFTPSIEGIVQSLALIHIPTTLSNTAGHTIFETVLIAGGKHFTPIQASTGTILASSISLPLNASIATIAVNDDRGEIFIGGNFRSVNGKAFSPIFDQTFSNTPFSVGTHSLAKIFYSPQTQGFGGSGTFTVNTQLEGGVIDRNFISPIFSLPPATNEQVFALAAVPAPFQVFVGGKFQQSSTRDIPEFPNGLPTKNFMVIEQATGVIAKAPISDGGHTISKKSDSKGQSLIHAYPNPATGAITVEAMVENNDALAEVTLINALGHRLKSWQVETRGDKIMTHLDLSAYTPGIYRVQIVTARGESRTIRIIKQ